MTTAGGDLELTSNFKMTSKAMRALSLRSNSHTLHLTLPWRMQQLRRKRCLEPVVVAGCRAIKQQTSVLHITREDQTKSSRMQSSRKALPPAKKTSLDLSVASIRYTASSALQRFTSPHLNAQYINQGRHTLKARHVDIQSSLFCVRRIQYPRSFTQLLPFHPLS